MRVDPRGLGLLLIVIGGGLGWLSYGDRRSPVALQVVEWDGLLGIPLASIALGLGLAFLLVGILKSVGRRMPPAPPPRAPPPRPRRIGAPAGAAMPDDWRGAAEAAANDLLLEDGARLEGGVSPGLPYVLVLQRMPRERARRAIEAYAGLLAGMPTPPRGRVTVAEVEGPGAPMHHLVAGLLSRHFGREAFSVVPTEGRVEIRFNQPDPRWEH